MATYSTSQFKKGLKIIIDGSPCNIIENEFTKPGKGQAFNKIKIKNLIDGKVLEKTYKSGDSVETADVINLSMQYLYNDGDLYYFMDTQSYEQYSVQSEKIKDQIQWLVEQSVCNVIIWNNQIIAVEPPNHIVSEVIYTEPGVKGNTVSSGVKSATLKTNALVKVPLFVNIGDKVKIDTRNGEYLSRG